MRESVDGLLASSPAGVPSKRENIFAVIKSVCGGIAVSIFLQDAKHHKPKWGIFLGEEIRHSKLPVLT